MNKQRMAKLAWVLGPLVGPIVLCGLLYWTWCWGLWGRGNLLFQYLWQCSCPPASEQVRYRPFKVVVSACSRPTLKGFSPSGRYIVVFEDGSTPKLVRVDLQTGEILDTGHPGATGSFVTDDLIITNSAGDSKGYTLIDLSDGTRLQLPEYDNFDAVVDKLRKAERVIITDNTYFDHYVVGLVHDYKNNGEDNVALYWDAKPQRLFDRLAENAITYTVAPPPSVNVNSPPNYYVYPPNEQSLYADWRGVYLSVTGQLVPFQRTNT